MTITKLEIAASTEVTVDKNISMPRLGSRDARYPWTTMEIGDSFVIPPERQKHFSRTMTFAGSVNNRKFAQRKMPDGTHRCWRIA